MENKNYLKNKVKTFLFFSSIGIVIPLLPKLNLLLSPKLLVMIISCAIMLMSAPPILPGEAKENEENDKSTVLILSILGAIGLSVPILDWAYFSEAPHLYGFLNYLGLGLIIIGFIIRITAIKQLGKQFTATVQIVEDHQLITTGLYKYLRHPSYTGALITFLGGPLWLGGTYSIFIVATCMTLAYYLRIVAEETTLRNAFGNSYKSYSEKTWRLIPFIW